MEVDLTIGSHVTIAFAQAGTWGSSPLHVQNCRPRVGDAVFVRSGPQGLFGITQVTFGDGSKAGLATSSCNPAVKNVVEEEHRYARAGRYLLEATTRYPCNPPGYAVEPVVDRVEIEVTDPRLPEAPGAAPCTGLGPVSRGSPPPGPQPPSGRHPLRARRCPPHALLGGHGPAERGLPVVVRGAGRRRLG